MHYIRAWSKPILEYVSNVLSPHCDKDVNGMEAAQRRAARFAINCYSRYQSVTGIMQKLNWPTLRINQNL